MPEFEDVEAFQNARQECSEKFFTEFCDSEAQFLEAKVKFRDPQRDVVAVIPGEHGAVTTEYRDGTKRTTWPDKTERVVSKDETSGIVRKKDGTIHSWGPKDADNYDWKHNPDGSNVYTYADKTVCITRPGFKEIVHPDKTKEVWIETKDGWTGRRLDAQGNAMLPPKQRPQYFPDHVPQPRLRAKPTATQLA